MKMFMWMFFRFARAFARSPHSLHDETLRANQGSPPVAYSAWRALVSNGHGR